MEACPLHRVPTVSIGHLCETKLGEKNKKQTANAICFWLAPPHALARFWRSNHATNFEPTALVGRISKGNSAPCDQQTCLASETSCGEMLSVSTTEFRKRNRILPVSASLRSAQSVNLQCRRFKSNKRREQKNEPPKGDSLFIEVIG